MNKKKYFLMRNFFLFVVHTVKTTDLVQFKWTTTGSEEKLILITLNNPDSLIVENACIPNRVFNFSCCE